MMNESRQRKRFHLMRSVSLAIIAMAILCGVAVVKAQPTGSAMASAAADPIEEARRLLPPSFRTHETQRFIVFSDAEPKWVQLQAERLERAAHQFHRVMRRIGVEPGPIRHKLVCVLFDDHAQFLHFAATYDNVRASWVTGYYMPKYDRIVFYNMESSPDIDKARKSIHSMELEVNTLRDLAESAEREGNRSRADALRSDMMRYKDHVRSERQRIEKFTQEVVVATIIHEAIHQLAYHTGVQRMDVEYPFWINEGLATAFESAMPNHAFGPDHEYETRRAVFQKHLADDALLPLREFVQLTSFTEADHSTVTVAYHQSYALLTWMMRSRRAELRAYLELMQLVPSGAADSEIHLMRFEEAFGSIDRVEQAWLAHERAAVR